MHQPCATEFKSVSTSRHWSLLSVYVCVIVHLCILKLIRFKTIVLNYSSNQLHTLHILLYYHYYRQFHSVVFRWCFLFDIELFFSIYFVCIFGVWTKHFFHFEQFHGSVYFGLDGEKATNLIATNRMLNKSITISIKYTQNKL